MFSENVKKSLDVVLKVSAGSHGNQNKHKEKFHKQAISIYENFDNSSKLGKLEQFQYLKKNSKRI